MASADKDKIQEFARLVKEKCVIPRKPAAIFGHEPWDPDCFGAGLGLKLLIKRSGGRAVLFSASKPSHPQNRAIVNLLKITLNKTEDFRPDDFGLVIFVDVSYPDPRVSKDVKPDVIFDHHVEKLLTIGKILFYDVREIGATSTVVLEYIRELIPDFDPEDDECRRVANALYWGIRIDTHNGTDQGTTDLDIASLAFFKPFLIQEALRKIENYDLPFDLVRIADDEKEIDGDLLVTGVGFVDTERSGEIATVSDTLLRHKNVETSVVFAIVGHDRLQVSVRTDKNDFSIDTFLTRVFGEGYSGMQAGGHSGGATVHAPRILVPEEDATKEEKSNFWFSLSSRLKRKFFKAYSGN